jgi:hypothetical protein
VNLNFLQPFLFLLVVVCPVGSFFPNFNTMYGCDYGVYATDDIGSYISKDATKNFGLELTKTEKKFLSSSDDPCLMGNFIAKLNIVLNLIQPKYIIVINLDYF